MAYPREGLRRQAAELYWDAFGPKLGPILGEVRGPEVLARTFHLDRAIVASHGQTLLGLAGVQYGGHGLTGIDWTEMRRTYGLLGGTARLAALALLDRTNAAGELVMDGIVVSPEARGKGVGSRLLAEVLALAAAEGYRTVRLDVVDTNPAARRLYERLGFVPTETTRVPWLRRWMGFGASTTLIRPVEESDSNDPL